MALFWHFEVIASAYTNEIPTLLRGTLTHPFVLLIWTLGPQVQTLPSAATCLWSSPFLDSYLMTALGSCLFSSSSLIGNLPCKPFVWVLCQNRQRNPLTGAHPHPHPQNECPPSCQTMHKEMT